MQVGGKLTAGWELCPLCLQELAGHSRITIPSEVRGEEKQPSRNLEELADVTDFLQETLVADWSTPHSSFSLEFSQVLLK